jgi:cob(I)alamin adenosyltransferase
MTKLFTGLGDDGTTGLLSDERVMKSDIRLEADGTLDELSAFLGFAKCQVEEKKIRDVLEEIQRDLYKIMTEIVSSKKAAEKIGHFPLQRVLFLEQWITAWNDDVELPDEFILPGETKPSAVFSICRTIARKAERILVQVYSGIESKNPEILRYMNRLSSLLFLLELKYSKKSKKQKLKFAKVSL